MTGSEPPVPENEKERIVNLAEFGLDFSDLEDNFRDLTLLAAKIAGTPMSLVNLINSYKQCTIASYGLPAQDLPSDNSICQYTVMGMDAFEVKNLAEDNRFKNRHYVKEEPHLRYYLGVPLITEKGCHIGALCVLNTQARESDPEKTVLLTIVAREIVHRLQAIRTIKILRDKAAEANEIKKRVVHDIRGPIGGIIGIGLPVCHKT